jgi:hypothetical protein
MYKIMRKSRVFWSQLGGGILTIVFFAGSCTVKDLVRHSPFCKGEVRNRDEILEITDDRLGRFCAREGIDREDFMTPPELTLNETEKLWTVDYQSSEHFVRFTVDNCGSIETSSGPSGKVTKIE